MLKFNNLQELKPYYNEVTNTYEFNDSVKFKFNLDVDANIKAWDINALDIKAHNIIAGDINARNINAHNINALDINAHNINALDINARNIKAHNINAWDINALDINAWNITYHAVCFSYNDIYCTSIQGRRVNHKHFVLDGEITIQSKPKQVTLELTDEQLVKIKEVLGIK